MPGAPPDGEPVPTDGALPVAAVAGLGQRGFGVYVHVPFCASRCGYCDFNTYTAMSWAAAGPRTATPTRCSPRSRWRPGCSTAVSPVQTVFVGGGTPTLLPADDLARILAGIDKTFGLAADAEVTTEANPESVDPGYLRALRAAGFTRISLGMQSAAPARAGAARPPAHAGPGGGGRRRPVRPASSTSTST